MRAERRRVSKGWTGTMDPMTHSAWSPLSGHGDPSTAGLLCCVPADDRKHRPGDASVVLTKHYEKTHPEMVSSSG
jgi:hypothetical protein